MFKYKTFLLLSIFLTLSFSLFSQSLSNKTVEELNIMKKEAVASENYSLAGKIKAQIQRLEENKEKINNLEKEKEAALVIEDYDKVIALEKEINALKSGKKYVPTTAEKTEEAPKVLPPKPAQPKPAPKKKRSAMQRYFKPRADGT